MRCNKCKRLLGLNLRQFSIMFDSYFLIMNGSSLFISPLRVYALRKAAAYKLFFSMLRYICKSHLYMKL